MEIKSWSKKSYETLRGYYPTSVVLHLGTHCDAAIYGNELLVDAGGAIVSLVIDDLRADTICGSDKLRQLYEDGSLEKLGDQDLIRCGRRIVGLDRYNALKDELLAHAVNALLPDHVFLKKAIHRVGSFETDVVFVLKGAELGQDEPTQLAVSLLMKTVEFFFDVLGECEGASSGTAEIEGETCVFLKFRMKCRDVKQAVELAKLFGE